MHCHSKEGSPDGKVSVGEMARILSEKGFAGMMITDHDSYDGFRAWKRKFKKNAPKNFVVLKGIEYDTIDAGHILVVMPNNFDLKILEVRGLPVYVLADIVHKNGGILGPAHPFGERYLSIFRTGIFKYHSQIAREFDFIEGFNACICKSENDQAEFLANCYNKPKFGGSDAHKADCLGMGYTEIPDNVKIRSNNDLIRYVKAGGRTLCGGQHYNGTIKDKIGLLNHVLVEAFGVYNRLLGLVRKRRRLKELIDLRKYTDMFY